MRRTLWLPVVLLLVLPLLAFARELPAVYGAGVGDEAVTPISKILSHPEKFDGKQVKISGTVVAVCEHRGCWVELASDREGETLRVKVEDGKIVFPREIVGHRLTAEGTFTIHNLDLETTRKVCSMQAEKEGKQLDPAAITECMKVYQVHGTGAVLER